MMNSKKLKNFIQEYEKYIKRGNEMLQIHFTLEMKSPLLARREGQIPKDGEIDSENMKFSFHGMGCRLEFGKIVVDFDYSFTDFMYKGFETSKLYWFIESCLGADHKITKDNFHQLLKQLEEEGFIISKEESSYDTHDYIVNQ